MITQEQYDKLNEGDTVTVERTYDGLAYRITGEVYKGGQLKCVGDKNLHPDLGGCTTTLIEHIPGTPVWHSAQVISAVNPKGERLIHVRSPRHEGLWVNARGWYERTEDLEDVKILVDKDVEL